MNSPLEEYLLQLEAQELTPDAAQREAMMVLDVIATELQKPQVKPSLLSSITKRLFKDASTPVIGVQGLYLWGGVGRGKTHLCDLFYDCVDIDEKVRLHFHRFMQRIHSELNDLGQVDDPLAIIAEQWATCCRLLVLDEIHVNDITDAMLLGRLTTELFKRGVTLVTTSNVPPDGLYKDGLQRAQFVPAIDQIKAHTTVIELVGATDYRLRLLQTEAIYIVSEFVDGKANDEAQQALLAHFDRLKTSKEIRGDDMLVNGRNIPLVKRAGDIAWFSFETLCDSPRSTADYIELATTFQTIILCDVPVLDKQRDDAGRRFINLIDEFYDRHVKLIVSAQAQPDDLYQGDRLKFEFVRAASRLQEMQTVNYLKIQREAGKD